VVVTLLILFLASLALAQRRERMPDTWKPLHYEVFLSFDDQLTGITSARTDITLQIISAQTTNIDLDFGDMPVDSVAASGRPVQYRQSPEMLNVALSEPARKGERLNLSITYHGLPKDGLTFAVDRDGKPSVTGDNWPNRVHHWIPTFDHPSAKASVSFTISAPQRYQVIANGKLLTLTGNAATSQWKFEEAKAIPPYCMVITVNEGAIINSPDKTVTHLIFNVPQRDREYAPKGFSSAGPALAFFTQTIAPYPYDKLALIVATTRFGGMENSSAIVFPNTLFDPRGTEKQSSTFPIPARIESLVAHEIAHQWFGDSVTELTWADLWLSEGFATYFAGLFIEKHDGEAAFREYMNDARERYFAYEKRRNAPIHDTATLDLMKLLNENNYEKGAWVLHMLRKRLGDEAFFRGIRNFYLAHREGNATSEDLRSEMENSSGKNLKGFFARWIYGAGHPVYQASWRRTPGGSVVTITQTQAGAIFNDPITVQLKSGGRSETKTVVPAARVTTMRFRQRQRPDAIEIDPDNAILKEVLNSR
jgi:aminopeptidase N